MASDVSMVPSVAQEGFYIPAIFYLHDGVSNVIVVDVDFPFDDGVIGVGFVLNVVTRVYGIVDGKVLKNFRVSF